MNLLSADKIQQFIIDFSLPKSTAMSLSFWITLAFVVVALICAFAVKEEKSKKLCRVILSVLFATFVLAVIITFLVLEGEEAKEDGMSPMLYAPLTVFAVVLVATLILNLTLKKKLVKIITSIVLCASILAVIVCLSVYYASGDALEFNWLESDQVNTLGLWLSVAGLIVLIVLLAIFTDKEKSLHFDVKSLAYAGVLGGLSFALSYIRMFKMPMGGSITLASVLPIMIYAYMFGTKKGVILGAVLGIMQAIQDPWILHPAQFLLDYPVAFSTFGLAGCLANVKGLKHHAVRFLLAGILAGSLRFMSHFFAGVFAFGAYADLEKFGSVYAYSAVYQVSYILPDTAIALVLGCLLMLSKSFTKVMIQATTTREKKAKSENQ